MIGRFEELYNSNPTEYEIQCIKEEFMMGCMSSCWEDYYWGAKCISVYDKDDFNPEFLIEIISNALSHGLTLEENRECFISAEKMLATIHSLIGEYDDAVESLEEIINAEEAPAWVFHDLVSAQNHTTKIKDNLKEPSIFLEYLYKTDSTISHANERQARLFKEFLSIGQGYIQLNPDTEVDIDTLREAASKYDLLDSESWIAFEKACRGDLVVERSEKSVEPDESENLERKYADLLAKLEAIQAELDDKKAELDRAGNTLNELMLVNKDLEESIQRYQTSVAIYEEQISKKDEELSNLEDRLNTAELGSSERANLEEKIQAINSQKAEMESRIKETKEALNESEEKLAEANKIIADNAEETAKLKEELETAKKQEQIFSYSKSAEIRAKCKYYEFIVTDKLARWLERNFSDYNNWWQRFVIRRITYEQASRAKDYDSLHDFDLAALLRIMVNDNWVILKQCNWLTESDHDTAVKMFDVRNNLSHSNTKPVDKKELIVDLKTMSDFLDILNANTEKKQVIAFAKEISNMQLD